MQKVMGIDPDAEGFVCTLVGEEPERTVSKRFSVSTEGLEQFIR